MRVTKREEGGEKRGGGWLVPGGGGVALQRKKCMGEGENERREALLWNFLACERQITNRKSIGKIS